MTAVLLAAVRSLGPPPLAYDPGAAWLCPLALLVLAGAPVLLGSPCRADRRLGWAMAVVGLLGFAAALLLSAPPA